MKIYISCDMEGCSGTAYRAQMHKDPSAPGAYERAQRFLTDDVMAAVEGVLEVDPEAEIWFNDAHGRSMNVFFEELPENVKAVVGSAELMDEVLGIDGSFDVLICIGSHGNVLTEDAVLNHVWDVREVRFNGKSLSETGLNASLAGYYGVPLVAISGDEASVKAIREEISPKIAAAVVKKGLGRYSAICINPKKTKRLIREAVIDGLQRKEEIPAFTFKNPITVDITYRDQFNAYAHKFFVPEDERVSSVETRFVAENAKDAYYGFLARDKLSKARHQ
jgi:D-amino peptidase